LTLGGRWVDPGWTAAWFRRWKLKCDDSLSNFGYNFNLRLYNKIADRGVRALAKLLDNRSVISFLAGANTHPLLSTT
jgi:hypothetical protein